MPDKIEIEIDGQTLKVEQGTMLIEAADNVGIEIPRFCYHKKLSIAANCRMCLVDVEKSPKPLPACATPVSPGMKVFTKSAKAIDAQKSVMEFLLINHPLDCPVCDQGGECELQDVSMGYGPDVSRFNIGKRSVADEDLGSQIATEMTRCIHCTRCVRFGEEVAGFRELGAIGRGEHMEIGTYIKESLKSEVSGNIIDLCPVGALTSKPFRFRARAWEMQQRASIAPHDCLGSNIYLHTLRDKQVMRVVPRENESINETWLSDRDRFSYEGLYSDDRLQVPMIKQSGRWQATDWQTAFDFLLTGIKKNINAHGVDKFAALASPSSTTEELFLLQKLMRGLGTNNIDHRIRQTDFRDQDLASAFPDLGISIEDLEKQDAILLVGSNVRHEQPLAGLRIRKGSLHGTKVMAVNPIDYEFNFALSEKVITPPNKMIESLAAIAHVLAAKAMAGKTKSSMPDELSAFIKSAKSSDAEKNIAKQLKKGSKSAIVLGNLANTHPQASLIRSLTRAIAELSDSSFGAFSDGANSSGAWLAGAIPHRGPAAKQIKNPGLNAQEIFQNDIKCFLFFGIEPELDCENPAMAMKAINAADFVVSFSAYKSGTMWRYSDVVLPITPFAETSGTFVNVEGKKQSFAGALPPYGDSRPGWKVLRVLANMLKLEGFEYNSSQEVRDELHKLLEKMKVSNEEEWLTGVDYSISKEKGLQRIGEWSINSIDSLSRNSKSLQHAPLCKGPAIYMNNIMAGNLNLTEGKKINVSQGESSAQLHDVLDARVPSDCALIPSGYAETAGLGASFSVIEIMT